MAFKVTYFWQQMPQRPMGWTENFWATGSSFEGVMPHVISLQAVLGGIHGRQTLAMGYRVTFLNALLRPTRLTRLIEPTGAPEFNGNIPSGTNSDYPTTAILLRGADDVGHKTSQWIKGIPDDASLGGGKLNLAVVVGGDRFQWFLNELNDTNKPWRIRITDTDPPRMPITAVEAVTETFTVTGHGLTNVDYVKITGVGGTAGPYVNKVWPVLIDGPNAFTLVGYAPPAGVTYQLSKARAQKNVLMLVEADWKYVRITSRQVGGPFAVVSGRRKTRR